MGVSVYKRVCVYLSVYMCLSVCVCVWGGGEHGAWKTKPGAIFRNAIHLVGLRVTILNRLTGQRGPGILLSLHLQCWNS